MSQIYHTRVVSKRKMNDDDDLYKSFQRQQEMLNIQMFKMHQKDLEEMVNVEKNVKENVENVDDNVKENVENVDKNVKDNVDYQNPSDNISIIREELESYKKQTDGRIEKLVNLFLSIDK
jgi:acetyl-CoA carboxylase alpha subunit